jgi:hypothetical protein
MELSNKPLTLHLLSKKRTASGGHVSTGSAAPRLENMLVLSCPSIERGRKAAGSKKLILQEKRQRLF